METKDANLIIAEYEFPDEMVHIDGETGQPYIVEWEEVFDRDFARFLVYSENLNILIPIWDKLKEEYQLEIDLCNYAGENSDEWCCDLEAYKDSFIFRESHLDKSPILTALFATAKLIQRIKESEIF